MRTGVLIKPGPSGALVAEYVGDFGSANTRFRSDESYVALWASDHGMVKQRKLKSPAAPAQIKIQSKKG